MESQKDPAYSLSSDLSLNIKTLKQLLPIDKSFDLVTRNLYLGETRAFFLTVNGMCKTDTLQQILSDLQDSLYTEDHQIKNLPSYINGKLGYAQVTFTDSYDKILQSVLSGPSLLLVDGFQTGVLIDTRTYPTRSITEPDAEQMTRGARDGFVETLLTNANLIRRRIRSPQLTFSLHTVGKKSNTDVVLCYLDDCVNRDLLEKLSHTIDNLSVTSLTMDTKSLEELLVKKRWWNPLPSIQITERPDIACSYLLEGHILILVDNSPLVLILPCTIFQFTQSPEDYYKSPIVGSYFRLIRLLCIPVNLLLMPGFLLLTAYYPRISDNWQLLSTEKIGPVRIIFYIYAVEFLLDLFKYSASVSSGRFSGSLSVVGGLLIGDMAVNLNWTSPEILFYAAITLLTSLSLSSMEFADALKIYRLFLITTTAIWGLWGFTTGLFLIFVSMITTPTFGKMSYFWPLFPFQGKALLHLILRLPTTEAQPCKVWRKNEKT